MRERPQKFPALTMTENKKRKLCDSCKVRTSPKHPSLDGLGVIPLKRLIACATKQLDDTTNYVAIVGKAEEGDGFVIWMRLHGKEEDDDCSHFGERLMEWLDCLQHCDLIWAITIEDDWTRSGILKYINEQEAIDEELALHYVERDFKHKKITHGDMDFEEVLEAFEAFDTRRRKVPFKERKAPTFEEIVKLFDV